MKTKKGWILSTILLLFNGLAIVLAQGTDLNGTWVLHQEENALNARRGSNQGGSRLTLVIEHTPESIVIDEGWRRVELVPGAGAQEDTSRMGGTVEANWEGSDLVVQNRTKTPGGEVVITTTWSLSEDGNTLTQEIIMETPQGNQTTTMDFDRQFDVP